MTNALLKKFKESSLSILPIMCIVLILAVTIVPMSWQIIVQFIISCILLIFGMTLFTHGADTAMIPIGQHIGGYLSKSGKLWFMLLCGFVLGVLITIAEPDLSVLADQVASINSWIIIAVVGVGVGTFMMLAVLRAVYQIPLPIILAVSYGLTFLIACFVPAEFAPLSFDSGSVTTGPISVPFLMSFGLGLAAVRSSKSNSGDESFGLVALGSAGPILAVMLMGLFVDPSTLTSSAETSITAPQDFGGILMAFLNEAPSHLLQVTLVILPILVVFLLFQFFALKLPKQEVFKIIIGLLFVFVGITLFFVGVSVGFLPVGTEIGNVLASVDYNWILIPVALVIGLVIVLAEPAVHVLTEQVEHMTDGKISRKTILFSMSIGVAISLGLCALRVLFQIPIWYILVPAYVIAIGLAFVVPRIFTGIAFDSGGVATGAMATTFALPLFSGACVALGENVMLYGFGTLSFIAVTPLITIQILGLIVKIANKRKQKEEAEEIVGNTRIEIVEFD